MLLPCCLGQVTSRGAASQTSGHVVCPPGPEGRRKKKLGPICRRHYCASHPRRKRHKAFYDAREALGRTVRTHPELLLLFLQPIHPLPFCSSTNLGYLSPTNLVSLGCQGADSSGVGGCLAFTGVGEDKLHADSERLSHSWLLGIFPAPFTHSLVPTPRWVDDTRNVFAV